MGNMRIFQNGKQLVNEDNTPYEIASPYTSDMFALCDVNSFYAS